MTELPILVDLHENIYFDQQQGQVCILDRRNFPNEISYFRGNTYEEVARAVEQMVTQSLGVSPAAGYGVAMAAYQAQQKNMQSEAAKEYVSEAVARMKNTRPTQTSLHHLVDNMKQRAIEVADGGGDLFQVMRQQAYDWTEHIMNISRKMGRFAAERVEDGDTILTHCYGGPAIYFTGHYAREEGKQVSFFATETRPYLQGARLTSHALQQGGFDVTLITDSMPALCLQRGLIDKLITGVDRISMEGGVANKIGTYPIALAADKYDVPFYAHSYDGPDPDTDSWEDVEIEERSAEEIAIFNDRRIAPQGVNVYYPAFDCTPPELVTGIVTEKGIYKPANVDQFFDD